MQLSEEILMSFKLMEEEKQYLNLLRETKMLKHVGSGPVDPAPKEKETNSPVEDAKGQGTAQAATDHPNKIPPISYLKKELAKEEVDQIISGGVEKEIEEIISGKLNELSLKTQNRMAQIAAANAGKKPQVRYVPGSPAERQAKAAQAAKVSREQEEHDEDKETREEEKAESPEMQKKEKEEEKEKHKVKVEEHQRRYSDLLKETKMLRHVGSGPVDPAPKEKETKSPVEDTKGEGTAQAATGHPNQIPPISYLKKELAKEGIDLDQITGEELIEYIKTRGPIKRAIKSFVDKDYSIRKDLLMKQRKFTPQGRERSVPSNIRKFGGTAADMRHGADYKRPDKLSKLRGANRSPNQRLRSIQGVIASRTGRNEQESFERIINGGVEKEIQEILEGKGKTCSACKCDPCECK
jgi:hypothetical protein